MTKTDNATTPKTARVRRGAALSPRQAAQRSSYNPRKVQRAYWFEYEGPDGDLHYATYSHTRPGTEVLHKITLGPHGVFCGCENFTIEHAKHEPTLRTPDHWCKHVRDCVEIARGESRLSEEWFTPLASEHTGGEERTPETPNLAAETPLALFYFAKPRSARVVTQLFVYADVLDIPDSMKLIAVELAADATAAVRTVLTAHGMDARWFRLHKDETIEAWEVHDFNGGRR